MRVLYYYICVCMYVRTHIRQYADTYTVYADTCTALFQANAHTHTSNAHTEASNAHTEASNAHTVTCHRQKFEEAHSDFGSGSVIRRRRRRRHARWYVPALLAASKCVLLYQ
jgi:hypothetical protein